MTLVTRVQRRNNNDNTDNSVNSNNSLLFKDIYSFVVKGHTIERCMKTSKNVTNPKRKYSLWLFHHSLRKEHTHHHHKEHNIHMTALRKIELGHVQGLTNNIHKIFSLFNFTGGGSNSFLNVGKLENDLRCWYAARGISLEIEQQ